jgi:hypothetical protein
MDFFFSLFFLEVLGFELRALCFLAVALQLEPYFQPFVLWLLWRQGLIFCPGWPGPQSSYFRLPVLAVMTNEYHHAQLSSAEIGRMFLPGLAWNCDSPISASQVARITGLSHWYPAWLSPLIVKKKGKRKKKPQHYLCLVWRQLR